MQGMRAPIAGIAPEIVAGLADNFGTRDSGNAGWSGRDGGVTMTRTGSGWHQSGRWTGRRSPAAARNGSEADGTGVRIICNPTACRITFFVKARGGAGPCARSIR